MMRESNFMLKRLALETAATCARLMRQPDGLIVCSAPVPERNRGDQALLAVVTEELLKRGQGPITVLTTSNQPIESLPSDGIVQIREEFFPLFLTRRAFREELRFPFLAARHRELLMIGADVLDEGYSVERSESSLHVLTLAARLGLKTRILGFSVNGPPSTGLRERLSKLGRSTRLFVRDPESYRRLEQADIPGIERAGDLAFLLKPVDESELPSAWKGFIAGAQGRLLGVNLTSVVMEQYGREAERLALFAVALARLTQEDNYRLLLIPHDEPQGVDYLRKFQLQLEALAPDRSLLIDPLPHCRVLKRVVGSCRHLFTCRLHLGIAALGMEVPVTGFPYQGKFEGQFELFGLSSDGLIRPDKFPKTVDECLAMMRRRLAESDALRQQIHERLPAVRALSQRNFDGLGSLSQEPNS